MIMLKQLTKFDVGTEVLLCDYNSHLAVATIARETKAQVILSSGRRFRKSDGREVGGKYPYIYDYSQRDIDAYRAAQRLVEERQALNMVFTSLERRTRNYSSRGDTLNRDEVTKLTRILTENGYLPAQCKLPEPGLNDLG